MNGFFISLMMVIMLSIGKMITRNWTNPAFLMILFWSVFIIAPSFVFSDGHDWNYYGLIWIAAACLFFSIGNAIGNNIASREFNKNLLISSRESDKRLSNISWNFILLCIIIGVTRSAFDVILNGFSFRMFFDIDSLIAMNTSIAYQRYFGGGATYGLIMQVMLFFIYAGPICGGYAFVYASKRSQRVLCFATFIPIIGNILLTNGKAGLIACVFIWVSGFLVGYLEKFKKAPSMQYKTILKVGISGLLLFGFLYFSMLLRIGDLSLQTRDVVNNKFLVYAFGSTPAFDYWFGRYALNTDYSLGKYTFMGIFNTLGFAVREQGVYAKLYGVASNVFTAFRGTIEDFGIVGGLMFFIVFGVIAGYFFQCTLNRKKPNVMPKVFLAATYFFILYSFLISVWTYASFIMAFVIFAFYLWLSNKKVRFIVRQDTI